MCRDESGREPQLDIRSGDPCFGRLDRLRGRILLGAQPARFVTSLRRGFIELRRFRLGGGLFGARLPQLIIHR